MRQLLLVLALVLAPALAAAHTHVPRDVHGRPGQPPGAGQKLEPGCPCHVELDLQHCPLCQLSQELNLPPAARQATVPERTTTDASTGVALSDRRPVRLSARAPPRV